VIEEYMEQGEFIYNLKRYQYIEKYLIAFQDIYGYNELILHAPPINILMLFLLPSVF
jgi:hypothetical protein